MIEPLTTTDAMTRLFSAESRLQAMHRFEAELALTQAELGMIPAASAERIVAVCARPRIGGEIFAMARVAGNPAIPFVAALKRQLALEAPGSEHHVHFGATSQDVIDTALMLLAAQGLTQVSRDLAVVRALLADLAGRHAATPMMGRTLLQQALPITFGSKVMGWLLAADRAAERLALTTASSLALQFGGPVGTLQSFEGRGPELAARLAQRLGLPCPPAAWHTSRDRIGELAADLGLLTGAMGKIGRDVTLMMQSEVGELVEPQAAGKGGSSAMAHKRNPVTSLIAVAAAMEAPHVVAQVFASQIQEHERAAGAWHTEWSALPRLFGLAHAGVLAIRDTLDGLEVHAAAMRGHVDQFRSTVAATDATTILAHEVHRLLATRMV